LAAGALHLILINVIWSYYDRYYLVLVPTMAYLAAASLSDRRIRTWPAVVVLALWAVVGISGTRAVLATHAACARMGRGLEAMGVRPSDIDAGYALNGWRPESHPGNPPRAPQLRSDLPVI